MTSAPESAPGPKRTPAKARRSWWPGWIWAVPIAALLVVGWVELQANWSVLDAGSSRAGGGDNLRLTATAGPGADGQAQALSAVMGQLADRAADSLRRG